MSRTTLILLLFLGWGAGSTYWYTCHIKGLCGDAQDDTAIEQEKPKKREIPNATGALVFSENSATAQIGPGYENLLDSLKLLSTGEAKFLDIEGLYFKGEKAPNGFRNMGLARAESVKKRLAKHISVEKLRTSSRLVNDRNDGYWVNCTRFSAGVENKNEARIVETEQGLTIYFPSGSADALLDPALTARLNTIAEEMKATAGGANITGHTDSDGDPKLNAQLGQKRAEMVRDLFINKGVNPEGLRASSMGATQPKGDNSTAEGKALNRRIEIIFNDNKTNSK